MTHILQLGGGIRLVVVIEHLLPVLQQYTHLKGVGREKKRLRREEEVTECVLCIMKCANLGIYYLNPLHTVIREIFVVKIFS